MKKTQVKAGPKMRRPLSRNEPPELESPKSYKRRQNRFPMHEELGEVPLFYNTVDSSDFPFGNFLHKEYGIPPSNVNVEDMYLMDKEFIPYLRANIAGGDVPIFMKSEFDNKKEYIGPYVYHLTEMKALLSLYPRKNWLPLDQTRMGFALWYTDRSLIEDFLLDIKKFVVKKPRGKENNISLIIQKGPELDTQEYTVSIGKLDIALNYGEDFIPAYDKIVARLNKKKDKGIVLLHGIPGTGKTSLIKHLAKRVRKEILFVPPIMAESICSPSFIPFLMDHTDSVLIIEDAERILRDRGADMGTQGVSNILNLSDGILGDCLNIQVIATFNTDLKAVDQALLRKGRLIVEHEFKKLSVEQSNKLLEHLGKDFVAKEPMTLTDIYNLDEEVFKTKAERRAVGFNAR